jgi:hypothetical protein
MSLFSFAANDRSVSAILCVGEGGEVGRVVGQRAG